MTIPVDALADFFSEYRVCTRSGKMMFVDTLLGIEFTVDARKRVLTQALQYDILHPAADNKEDILRRSEMSVALFRSVFRNLPKEIDRKKYLMDVFSGLSFEAKVLLTQRQKITDDGVLTKLVEPFTLFYHMFLNMVFFDESALTETEFHRYSDLIMDIQALKQKIDNGEDYNMNLRFKLHNAVTEVEKIKIDFLQRKYGLGIDALAEACKKLYITPFLLVAAEANTIVANAKTDSDRVQFRVLLELNKFACSQSNNFGRFRSNEPKPLENRHSKEVHSVIHYIDADLTTSKPGSKSAAYFSASVDDGFFSFWSGKVNQLGEMIGCGVSEIVEGVSDYYLFPRY